MGTEFEHKLLVTGEEWRTSALSSSSLSQAYLCTQPGMTIRVRLVDDRVGYLTVKGKQAGIGRPEYEYEIPVGDARELLGLAQDGFPISKTRYELGDPWPGWVVDEFSGENAGLVVAELEVPAEDTAWEAPDWAGTDVTADPRYTNAVLYSTPYTHWS
ncbi:CYTH domain-containing protein [Microlunatus ginsengisoli]|uniref:CYTH domain-containing protein n=1 Tax=Microlunatus ginsengisoli TaxID=363863 RepID=A0ABP7A3B3_9ACTN